MALCGMRGKAVYREMTESLVRFPSGTAPIRLACLMLSSCICVRADASEAALDKNRQIQILSGPMLLVLLMADETGQL